MRIFLKLTKIVCVIYSTTFLKYVIRYTIDVIQLHYKHAIVHLRIIRIVFRYLLYYSDIIKLLFVIIAGIHISSESSFFYDG